MNKKGNILTENIIFIILNLVFISILFLFLYQQGQGAIILEESYSKQIALLLDNAKPGMIIKLNLDKGIELAEKNKLDTDKIVAISDNTVNVQLSEKGGYNYHFFTDYKIDYYRSGNYYYFVINQNEKGL